MKKLLVLGALATAASGAEWNERALSTVYAACSQWVLKTRLTDKYYVDATCSCTMGSIMIWERADDFIRYSEEQMIDRMTDHILYCAASMSDISEADKKVYYDQRKNGGAR